MNRFSIPRASRPVNARVNAVGVASASAARWTAERPRLRAAHERRPHLRGPRAGREHRRDAGARRDPAGRDERQVDRVAQLQEREQPVHRVRAVDERAAVAPRLGALHDERVGAGRGRLPRLVRRS